MNKKKVLASLVIITFTGFTLFGDEPQRSDVAIPPQAVVETIVEDVVEKPIEQQPVGQPVQETVAEKPVERPVEKPQPVAPQALVPQALAENEIESIVNDLRQHNGLARLGSNQKLRNSACAKARHMLENQYWAHNAPDGTQPWYFITAAGYSYSSAGENLAKGFDSGSATVSGWLNSPTHKANMLSGVFNEQGICSLQGDLLGANVTLTVQHLGKK